MTTLTIRCPLSRWQSAKRKMMLFYDETELVSKPSNNRILNELLFRGELHVENSLKLRSENQ